MTHSFTVQRVSRFQKKPMVRQECWRLFEYEWSGGLRNVQSCRKVNNVVSPERVRNTPDPSNPYFRPFRMVISMEGRSFEKLGEMC
jgi:hypothetical protein